MAAKNAQLIDRIIDVARGMVKISEDERENRDTKRRPYDGWVALVQIAHSGERSRPMVLQCKNIGAGGMCVVSRHMLHVGHTGAAMMLRSDGSRVILGAWVVHCTYVGNMQHESGVEFTELPRGIGEADFRDAQGNFVMPPLEQAA